MIFLGCSGWSYRDWDGPFYNSNSPSLRFYSNFFNSVEIDSTYYQIPSRRTVFSWINNGSSINFSVKLPGDISHGDGDMNRKFELWKRFKENVLNTILQHQDHICVLMTVPPSIKDTDAYMESISEITDSWNFLCVEPRTGKMVENYMEAAEIIRKYNFIPVSVDNFSMRIDWEMGNKNIAYLRLHGRNPSFYERNAGYEKFNYRYSEEELKDISEAIRKSEKKFQETFVFFNNHPNGNAPINGLEMLDILGISRMKRFL